MSKQFEKSIFDEDPSGRDENEILGVKVKNQHVLLDNFKEKQLKILRMVDQEYQPLEENIVRLRRALIFTERRIQLACAMKLFAKVNDNDEQDVQDEMVEIGVSYPALLTSLKDKNTFIRSFMLQYMFKLVFNEKPQKEQQKSLFKFLKKVNSIVKLECQIPLEKADMKLNEVKCYVSHFLLRMNLLKITEGLQSLEKIIKIYNDSPEIDEAAIVICKNLLIAKFPTLKEHSTYKFLIDEEYYKIIGQVLQSYDAEIIPPIIPLFVEVFQCNLIILNDTKAEQPEYYVPQTEKSTQEDITLYFSWERIYHSVFQKDYAEKHLSFCLTDYYLYQVDLKDFASKIKASQNNLLENEQEGKTQGKKEEKKWAERVKDMEETNKAKTENEIPSLICCECERELNDKVSLVQFDIYYFCEVCLQDMISTLIRLDKQFTYIGQSQVKRYQLRDALTELNKERDRIKQSQKEKKDKENGITTNQDGNLQITAQDAQNLIAMEMMKEKSARTEKQWEKLTKTCLKCGDDQMFPDERYLIKEVTTGRDVAICLTCLAYLTEQVRYTYRNIKLQGKFEISNALIKSTYQEFTRDNFDKLKQICVKCMKIRLHCFVLQEKTVSKPQSVICQLCFVDIFKQDERLSFYEISPDMKEKILDDIFRADFYDNLCVSCDKKGLKTLSLECLQPNRKKKNTEAISQRKIQSKRNLPKSGMFLSHQHNNPSSTNIRSGQVSIAVSSDEEDNEIIEKRMSKVCVECLFLNVGSSKNAYMDYLISYMKLRANIVYKYNNSVKSLIENDARKKLQKSQETCVMCLRRMKGLYEMNTKEQRICQDCFVKYRGEFKANAGVFDGYECNSKYQEQIFSQILANFHDKTQCIVCQDEIKTLEYEVLKLDKGFSNVIVCDPCIIEQLGNKPFALRHLYQVKSGLFKEVFVLQNKKEVDHKISAYQAAIKRQPAKATLKRGTSEQNQQSMIDEENLIKFPNNRQQFSSNDYPFKCFNKSCKELDKAIAAEQELKFIKMPKCSCLFCVPCFTAFNYRMQEARRKKEYEKLKNEAILSKIQITDRGGLQQYENVSKGRQLLQIRKPKPQKEEDSEVYLYCPGNLCNVKYSEYQIKDLADGHNIPDDVDFEESELKKELQKRLEQEIRENYSSTSISCSVCRKDDRILAIMNDDYFTSSKEKVDQTEANNKKSYSQYLKEEEELFKDLDGYCQCQFACKPCLFQLYYLDRCSRCSKKASPHIYKILFNFHHHMKCPRCQGGKFKNIEEGQLITRVNNQFKCENCQACLVVE